MQRLTIDAGSRCLRRVPGRRAKLAVRSRDCARLPTSVTALASPYPTSSATLHPQWTAFSTNSTASTKSPDKKERGLIEKFKRMLRTLFGADDDTPRGIQERKEMYWIVLTVALNKLRMENQRHLAQRPTSFMWQEESRERLKELVDEAASYLDEKTDITQMSLRRLRNEVQTFLGPQIVQLLTVAHDVEAEMSEEHDDYIFGEEEEQMYKEIFLNEYEDICRLINEAKRNNLEANMEKRKGMRAPDPLPFYETKKGAIEKLMTYFEWWPELSSTDSIKNTTTDEEEYMDEFGFYPNKADSDVVRAMRYHHARNLARSFLARRVPDDIAIHNYAAGGNTKQQRCYHSLLPLKSTIPLAGRGVFVDGFAPAGTLVAFIPGKVWTKEHLQSASLQTQMQLSQNDPRHQLSMRHDDVLIDSRQSPYTVVGNLWALGHIVNHPPAPTPSEMSPTSNPHREEGGDGSDDIINRQSFQGPNCAAVMINFTDRMIAGGEGEKLRDYIPNEYELPPTPYVKSIFEKDEVIMHGMGLIVSRDVRDEELFYDYRLSPDKDNMLEQGNQYPSWYYVWDEDAIKSRWDTDD